MFGLQLIDLIVIFLYFLVVIAIGIWSSRRIKNQEDYFLAGRKFGKFIQTFAAFGQGTSADTCVGVTTTTYTNGAAGIWSALIYLFATSLYWMVMPWMRRLRLLSPVEILQQSEDDIHSTICQLVEESANPDLTGVCCINMDANVADSRVSAIFSTIDELRKKYMQEKTVSQGKHMIRVVEYKTAVNEKHKIKVQRIWSDSNHGKCI
jgi:hypothetical protein